MTGYTVHTGASKKFVAGWDRVFGTNDSTSKSDDGKTAGGTKKKTVAAKGATTSGKKSKSKSGK